MGKSKQGHVYILESENCDLWDIVLSMLVNDFSFKVENQTTPSEDVVATIDTDINKFIHHKS